jgi:hypothetical protein
MKKHIVYSFLALVTMVIVSCDDNEVLPDYTKKGTATQTIASITTSKATPAPSEVITLTLTYVNTSLDPITEIVLKAKTGAGDYVTLETLNEQSTAKNSQVTREVKFTAPAASGTVVVFDMVLNSAKEYPQIKRTQIKVSN